MTRIRITIDYRPELGEYFDATTKREAMEAPAVPHGFVVAATTLTTAFVN